jgi:hypothetical protein
MTQVAIELPLYSDPSYQYSASIENQSRQFRFNWNDRTATWQMDLLNDDGTVVFTGQRLVAQYPMFVDYQMDSYGLTGYFILLQKNENQLGSKNSVITDIPDRYTMYYVYNEAT